jgi:hypothetical protein
MVEPRGRRGDGAGPVRTHNRRLLTRLHCWAGSALEETGIDASPAVDVERGSELTSSSRLGRFGPVHGVRALLVTGSRRISATGRLNVGASYIRDATTVRHAFFVAARRDRYPSPNDEKRVWIGFASTEEDPWRNSLRGQLHRDEGNRIEQTHCRARPAGTVRRRLLDLAF